MNERAVLSLLAFGCAAFAVAVFLELTAAPAGPAGFAPPFRRPEAPAATPAPPAPQLAQLVATTLARPLFSPTRRPPPRDGGAGGEGINHMRLTGIVTGPGERLAIFAVAGAKPLMVEQGEEVSGWRIDAITPSAVSVSGPGGAARLRPKPDKSLVRTAPPAPAAPAPPARFAGPARMPTMPPGRARFMPPMRPVAAGARQ